MSFRAQPVVGIQITDSGLNVAEGRRTESSLLITRLESHPFPSEREEERMAVLGTTLRRCRNRYVCLALPLTHVKHHFFLLPPLKKKNAVEIVRRELSQLGTVVINSVFFDFTIPEKGSGNREYAVVSAAKDTVLAHVSEVHKAGKKIRVITSCPFALKAALRHFLPSFETDICASLHIEGTTGLITIFNKGQLAFARSFSLRAKPIVLGSEEGVFKEDEEEDFSAVAYRIAQETNRSFLFYKQHSHGLMVEKVILSGDVQYVGELKHFLKEELGIEAQLFQGEKEGGILFDAGEVPADELARYAVPIGLLRAAPGEIANLVPVTVLEKGKIFWGRLAMTVSIVCLLGGVGVAHFTLSGQERILEETVAVQRSTNRRMRTIVEEIRKQKRNRERFKQLFSFSSHVLREKPFWTPFFQDISHVIPVGAVLEQTTFSLDDPYTRQYRFEFRGSVREGSVKSAQKTYETFVEALFSSPFVKEGEFSPPEISPVRLSREIQAEAEKVKDVATSLESKIEDVQAKGAMMGFQLRGLLEASLPAGDVR